MVVCKSEEDRPGCDPPSQGPGGISAFVSQSSYLGVPLNETCWGFILILFDALWLFETYQSLTPLLYEFYSS